uniref:SSD domain-containing protein n=1 Tax=Parastrongyloides trichosuri TaxID=131310 RepID=A0A0N4ZAX6_PARTI
MDEITSSDEASIFIKFLHASFDKIGRFVTKHYISTIIITIIVTTICGIHVSMTKQTSIPYGYTPSDARSIKEIGIFEKFFNQEGRGITIFVMVLAKDNGTMLREECLNDTVKIIDYLQNNITLYESNTGNNLTYSEFCTGFCEINEGIRNFYNGYQILWKNNEVGEKSKDLRINLSYPTTEMFGRTFSIQENMFGVKIRNSTSDEDSTNMEFAKMIILQLRSERKPNWTLDDVKNYENKVSQYLKDSFESNHVVAMGVSQSFLEKEMTKTGKSMEPFLGVGFILMTIFTITTTYISSSINRQFTLYKIILTISACIVPLMSTATTFSIMILLGFPFSPILAITPFLILAIGVDDSFLMIHAQQRYVSKKRKEINNVQLNSEDIKHCISYVCCETGPSILLSAFTNILAFFVGCITSPPEIQLFCIGNGFAILIDTLYQLTTFSAVMTYVCKKEFNNNIDDENYTVINRIHKKLVSCIYYFYKVNIYISLFLQNMSPENSKRIKSRLTGIVKIFISWITSWKTIILLFFLFIGFLIFSVMGISKLHIDLSPKKFFLPGSQLLDANYYKTEFVIPIMTPLMVFVNKPGNLSDPKNIERLEMMVNDFETMNDSIGKVSTRFFLRDFNDFNIAIGEEEGHLNLEEFDKFLSWPEYRFWKGFLKFKNNTNKLEAFFFTTGFQGEKLKDITYRGYLLELWREKADKYKSEFDISVYNDDAPVIDLIDVIPSVTLQSSMITFLSMAFVVFWFLYDTESIIIASTSIFFICLGVIGFLNWWAIDLDPIMMATIIMTIGFSVDMPAHICFHYHKAALESPGCSSKQLIEHTMYAVAFPIIQAGFSTIACVISLLWVNLYMGEVFVKSMTLCVLLSLLQGLVMIPIIFYVIEKISCRKKRSIIVPVSVAISGATTTSEGPLSLSIDNIKIDGNDRVYSMKS